MLLYEIDYFFGVEWYPLSSSGQFVGVIKRENQYYSIIRSADKMNCIGPFSEPNDAIVSFDLAALSTCVDNVDAYEIEASHCLLVHDTNVDRMIASYFSNNAQDMVTIVDDGVLNITAGDPITPKYKSHTKSSSLSQDVTAKRSRIDSNPIDNAPCHEIEPFTVNVVMRMLGVTSVYSGVSKCRANGWKAELVYNGECQNLGMFDREIDAADAYDNAVNNIYIKLQESGDENDISNFFKIYGDQYNFGYKCNFKKLKQVVPKRPWMS